MTSFSSLARPRRLWQSFFLLSLSAGLLHAPAYAGMVGNSADAEFGPLVLGATCTFSDPAAGTLALNSSVVDAPTIGTEVSGGSRASYKYEASFTGAQIVVDSPVALRNGNGFTPATNTIYASRNGGGTPVSGTDSVVLNNDLPLSDTLNVGLVFSPPDGDTSFVAGSYTARVTITCTDDGNK